MTSVFANKALLPGGWADNVRLSLSGGRIDAIEVGASGTDAERVDCLIPGLGNAHSHAFQRALAGHTEERSPDAHDNFWSWRERMYELASVIDAPRLTAIARQLYVEMISNGYTSVAEFHYLHRAPEDGMFEALVAARGDSGIRLSYVPVLYERAGFDEPGPRGAQTLFAQSAERYFEHREHAKSVAPASVSVGAGAHSIRAVSEDSLQRIASLAAAERCPMHLHIAEQEREVTQSLDVYGRRPVRWLLENFAPRDNWCLVHATHMDVDETRALAATGAVVALCPSTEANLGDGLFALSDYLRAGGAIAIGSDSHVSINPFEELRWLEYGQRLAAQVRNVAAISDAHVGHELFQRAIDGGAQACGHRTAGIAEGAHADLVCLYGDDPMLIGHDDGTRLDALVFSGYRLPIERVMVNGEWQVIDGEHVNAATARQEFVHAVESIRATS